MLSGYAACAGRGHRRDCPGGRARRVPLRAKRRRRDRVRDVRLGASRRGLRPRLRGEHPGRERAGMGPRVPRPARVVLALDRLRPARNGLSDRPREAATLESRMDDVRAVLDTAESERAVLFGTFEAASMCLLFAATYPERTLGLVLYNPVSRGTWAPDYPWAPTAEEAQQETARRVAAWGTYGLAEEFARGIGADLRRRSRVHRRPGAPLPTLREPGRGGDDRPHGRGRGRARRARRHPRPDADRVRPGSAGRERSTSRAGSPARD